MIDTHIHADSRSSEDFEKMYLSGIDTVITCGFYPYKISNENVLLNHLNKILEYDSKRAQKYGLDVKIALGVHPANINFNEKIIFDEIYKWIDTKKIIAIGEIGLEKCSDKEISIFKKQLKIADKTKTKVIVHTPRKNKKEVLIKIKEVLKENIDPKLVVIDHVNQNIIKEVINEDYTLGLTVQPEKMEVQEAIAILDEYGFNDFLLNSDISNMPSDPLSVPKTVRELEKLNYNKKEIEKVAFKNAKKFFKI
jgi:uncharacterized protein